MPSPFDAFADTAPTVTCPKCSCTPSHASCLLPYEMSANAGACPGSGSGAQPFSVPETWNGTCNTTNPVSSAASLTVEPPSPPGAGGCTAVVDGTTITEGPTAARHCESVVASVAPGTCGDQSMVCAYPKTDDFLTCIVKYGGEDECPAGWPDRHVVYGSSCGCTCNPPTGDSCSATVTVYEDGACSEPLGSVTVSSDQPAGCVDVPPGSTFGSKSSTPPVYKAGSCTPSLVQTHPQTFCCLP